MHAAVAAAEIYNKPNFPYREEIFSILIINAWELCLKAKYLQAHRNKLTCLYIPVEKKKKDGTTYKIKRYKTNRAGNYLTVEIKFLMDHIVLDRALKGNIESLLEIRDNVIHFLNSPNAFKKTFLEIATASLKGYALFIREEFNYPIEQYEFSIMPISFNLPDVLQASSLNKESPELKKLLAYLIDKRKTTEASDKYDVALNINVKLSRGKEGDLTVKYDKEGIPIFQESEERFREKYPLTYANLTKKLKGRYIDFKQNDKFYKIKTNLEQDEKYAKARFLDINNPKSSKKTYYSPEIIKEFDKDYHKK